MRNPIKVAKEFAEYLQVDAEVKKTIKDDMSEAQARRVVHVMAKRAIAKRARTILRLAKEQGYRVRPKDALKRARLEYRREFGSFR